MQTHADETALCALYRQLLDSWNQRNADAFAALFGEDGTQVGFDRSQINGRLEIASHLRQIFADHQTAVYVSKVREVRFLTPDTTIVRAVVGMIPPGKSELNPAVNAIQSLVAAKSKGRWRIALFHNTPAALHGRPELARQLTGELQQLL